MRRSKLMLLPFAYVVMSGPLASQDQVEIINVTPLSADTAVADSVKKWFPNSTISTTTPSVDNLGWLVRKTLANKDTLLINDETFYCVVHLVRWNVFTVERQSWLVYRGAPHKRRYPLGPTWTQSDANGQRIYGVRRIGVIYVYVDPPEQPPTYRVTVSKKTTTPLQDLGRLFQYALSVKTIRTTDVVWGGQIINVRYQTSNVAIEASMPAPAPRDTGGALLSIGKQTFDNEPRTWWDVSIAVPVHSVSEVSYSSESGVLTPGKIEREKVYATIDLYPFRVDPRGTGFRFVPLMLGISLAEKPFDHLLAASGLGIKAVRVFAGVAFNNDHKPKTLITGDSTSDAQLSRDRRTHYSVKFAFGLDVSVTSVLQLAKGQSAKN